ncbi:MAG: TauD/TfdA family dioxygenase [Patescibacteria group bacterium]|nr:TauD/TfdA family dioxygenase [Patescibacteria group bacterium]
MSETEMNLHTPAKLFEYDLASSLDYTRITDSLTSTVNKYGTANKTFASLGQIGLINILSTVSPSSIELLKDAKYQVKNGLGAVVLHNTCVELVPDQTAQLISITLSSTFGEPTKTDRQLEQISWPIKYVPDLKITPTFSQSLGEAAYHTDTQYFPEPEAYFGLFCRQADIIGKGTNRLLPLAKVVDSLVKIYGHDITDKLSTSYPFKVPSVFTESVQDSDTEIIWEPILTNNATSIRYRKDTIDAALAIPGIKIDNSKYVALNRLNLVLDELEPIEYHLQPGDALFVNNYRLLHARTAFDSMDRWLYRVRMKEIL